jgi:tetratricopeptide (TPR) repeat protein
MIGRRTADKVLTTRVRALVIGALSLALVAGAVMWSLFRTEIEEGPVASATAVVPRDPQPTPAADTIEEPPSTLDSTRALRAADRGNQLLAQGKVKAAVSLLGEAAQVLPDNAELAHTYGAALWRFEARDRALFQFRKALKLAPDSPVYREDLGRALHAMGHTVEAARVLQAPGLAAAALEAARAAADPEAPAPVGGNLGGAGDGSYKGRRSFTDADLRPSRVETPAPVPTEEPGR